MIFQADTLGTWYFWHCEVLIVIQGNLLATVVLLLFPQVEKRDNAANRLVLPGFRSESNTMN